MKFRTLALPAAALALAAPALAAPQHLPPSPGIYTAAIFIVAATGPENSCEFVAVTGQSYNGIFYYPGPNKPDANLRIVSATDNGPNVYLHEFPKTPAANATSWTGAGLEGFEGDTPLMPMKFKATIRQLDASSFTMTLNVKVTVGSNVCRYGANVALARSAPVN